MEWWIIEIYSVDNSFVAISSESNHEDMFLIVNILEKCWCLKKELYKSLIHF